MHRDGQADYQKHPYGVMVVSDEFLLAQTLPKA